MKRQEARNLKPKTYNFITRFFCSLLPVACCLFLLAGCGGGGGGESGAGNPITPGKKVTSLTVKTSPDNMSVYIDGAYKGKTSGGSLYMEIAPGTYTLKVEPALSIYPPKTEVIAIAEGQPYEYPYMPDSSSDIFGSGPTDSTLNWD